MLAITLVKIQDFERAIGIFARSCRAENIVFKTDGVEITLTDNVRKSVLFMKCQADFFDYYRCHLEFEAGLAISEVVTTLSSAYQVDHIKVLEIADTPEGQLHFSGLNPNGKRLDKYLSPHSVDTPYGLDPYSEISTYPFLLSLPSNWFHMELLKHQTAKWIRLVFDADKKKRELRVESDKQHGLNSQARNSFILEPENVVVADPNLPIQSQSIMLDTKYIRIMARSSKLSEDIRIRIKTGQPAIFEYIMKQSPTCPTKNSFVQLRVGPVVACPHPYVDP